MYLGAGKKIGVVVHLGAEFFFERSLSASEPKKNEGSLCTSDQISATKKELRGTHRFRVRGPYRPDIRYREYERIPRIFVITYTETGGFARETFYFSRS